MKKLIDGFEVPSRLYYYLLDWNDNDYHSFIIRQFGEMSISKLTITEFNKLLKHAFESDLKKISENEK